MKSFFLALCLFTTPPSAFAAVCSKTSGEPCTPVPSEETEAIKKEIVGKMKAARALDRKILELESQYLRIRDSKEIGADVKLSAYEPFRAKKMEQDVLFKDAITKTLELYHVKPDGGEKITIAAPRVPGIEWTNGLSAHWDPQVTDSGPGVKLAVEFKGSDKKLHYGGLIHMDTDGKYGKLALTLADGRVLILNGTIDKVLEGTFDEVLQKKTPNIGLLGSVLYHESRHFSRLSKENVGWLSPEEEVIAYNEELKTASIFGLTALEIGKITGFRAENYEKVMAPKLSSRIIDPNVEETWKSQYENEQINLEGEYKKLKTDVENERKLQKEKAAQADKKLKDESEARRIADETSVARTQAALKLCGFEPHWDPDEETQSPLGYTLGRSSPRDRNYDAYDFPNARTIPEFKVSLMLARTCVAVNDYSHHMTEHVDSPCNDGIDILNHYADDAAFLNTIKAVVWSRSWSNPKDVAYYPCVAEKIKMIRFPLDLHQYESLFGPEIKRNIKSNKQFDKQDKKDAEIRWRNRTINKGRTRGQWRSANSFAAVVSR